ncbi:MAG TPA: SdiA-regulated domain-containing protein [Bacteroidia bacterium]|nr:SdiA-regulated domain-containing protein [Bacteroidia bacterium]
MKQVSCFFFLILISTLFFACSREKPATCLPYDISNPAEVLKLPGRLKEISGITFWNTTQLACVQDEKGIVYFYDTRKDKLKNELSFGEDKDYEGIANVHDTLYVLCSNGDIFELDQAGSTEQKTITYKTFLNKRNNCEGLCFDEANNRLLVACKGRPAKGTAARFMKAIYSFSLNSKTLDSLPVYEIDPEAVNAWLKEDEIKHRSWTDLFKIPKHSETENLFEPSELAIHPLNRDVYLLSSVGKKLVVMDTNGTIECVVKLDEHLFKQPEGIAFTSTGDLFISDEGKDGKANIIHFHSGQ